MLASVVCVLAIVACTSSVAGAQGSETLPDFAPLLPQVKAQALVVDPQKGYLVKQLKPGIFMLTDGGYECAFVTTGKGVVLFDAPPTLARHISAAIAERTAEPLIELVYTHLHVDHIGGADLVLRQNPRLQILAEQGTADFLRERMDPHRPLPTKTFQLRTTLKIGSMTADMSVGHWHTPEGDLFIRFPDKKVLIAIDALSSGAVPFMGLDLTTNMHDYLKIFDQILATDFEVMVPGHHSNPAGRLDVETTREYVMDVYSTITRIHESDHSALMARALQKYGKDNSFAIGRVLIDNETDQCASEITSRWKQRLDNVDVWAGSHCRTALVYQEWDDGSR